MEQHSTGTAEIVWCASYPQTAADRTVACSLPAPVQIELGNADIVRQISQQMQLQYNNGQAQIVLHPIQHTQPQQQQQQQLNAELNEVPQQQQQQQQQLIHIEGLTAGQTSTVSVPLVPPDTVHKSDFSVCQVLQEFNTVPKTAKSRSGAGFERVPCGHCDKTFSCGGNLRDHMRLHTGEKPFKCSECHMEFAQRSNWRLHKRVHTGERPYMCGICGKTFARSSHLPGHMRIHTGEKPFRCDLCCNCFPSAQALKNHTRTHTGEKPFKCSFCDTAFTHSSSLSSHKKKCNGIKRKRGRPIGTGRRPVKKKVPSGRPRGRPKKKIRSGRGRKKLNPDPVDELGVETNEVVSVKREKIDDNDESNTNYDEPVDHDYFEEIDAAKALPSPELPKESNSTQEINFKQSQPKVAVRESVRLRIKHEFRKANSECLQSIKSDPDREFIMIDERNCLREASIIVDHESLQETSDCHHNIIMESNIQATMNNIGPSSDQLLVHSGSAVDMTSAMAQQQEAAVAMATLQQVVLNLTQPVSRSEEQLLANDFNRPVITYVGPTELHQQQANNGAVGIPMAHTAQQVIVRGEDQQHLQPTQFITCQVNGEEVHLPVAMNRSVSNVPPSW